MKRIWFGLLIPLAGLAQGSGGPGVGLNLARLQTVMGAVSAVRLGSGAQYPTVTVQQVTIKTAPAWFFEDHDFELKAGDPVKILAAPSNRRGDLYLHAIEISNTTTGAVLRIRDHSGFPVWSGAHAARGEGSGTGEFRVLRRCATSPITVSGMIDSVTAGAGIQMPVLVLQTADGQLLSIKIGPERILLAADMELKPGEAVTVVYMTDCIGDAIALQITNSAGVTVILRDDLGRPAWPQ